MKKEVLNTPSFIFNSTKADFRKKYYSNLEKLKQDFIIDENDFEEIKLINLEELRNTLEEENWSEFKGYHEGEGHTENSHTSHHENHHDKDSHRDDRKSFARFNWESLLTKYGEKLNQADFVNGIISKNK